MRNAECGMRNTRFSYPALRTPHSEFRIDVRRLVNAIEGQLQDAGIVSARAEAEWLTAGVLGTTRTGLYLWDHPLTDEAIEMVRNLVGRRIAGEPVQYLLGFTEFCGHRLEVGPGVFIPRPETEVITERAVAYLRTMTSQARAETSVLDVGTGSANMAIRLAHAVPTCVVIAVELSWEALQIAKRNVEHDQLGDRVMLIQADWTSALRGPFRLIVSNPPYVTTEELAQSPLCDGREPRMSLEGGADGMMFHRRLIAEAPRLLLPGGAICMECAETQAHVLAELASMQPWVAHVQAFDDLAGRSRGVWITRQ